MRKIARVIVCIILLASFTDIFSINSSSTALSQNRTIYVDDDNVEGPWDGSMEHPFQSIQEGINAAVTGDLIYVYSGVYNIFQVNKSISIQGSATDNTIINVKLWQNSNFITSDDVQISGFKFVGVETGLNDFIKISKSDNVTIFDCVFTNGLQGIEIAHSKHSVIYDCDFISVIYNGIFLNGLGSPSLEDIVIKDCYFYKSSIDIWGEYIFDILVNGCDFYECGLGYPPKQAINVQSVNSGLVIEDCYFQRNGWGIWFDSVNNAIVRNCVFYDHIKEDEPSIIRALGFGTPCSNNIIYSNVFAYNECGIDITPNSTNNLIYNNYFYQNKVSASDSGYNNIWYNETVGVGNYWDDYDGEDKNGDGIGDTPYPISGGSYDLFPKMNLDRNVRPPTPSAPAVDKNVLHKYENAEFSCSASDPNNDDVFYRFFWGDGTDSDWLGPYDSGASCTAVYSWNKSGVYDVRVMVKDIYQLETQKSTACNIRVSIPNTPIFTGPLKGKPNETYSYNVTSVDPDGDQLWYNIGWEGPGYKVTYTGWMGPYESGEVVLLNHNWTETGSYDVYLGARDSDGVQSEWIHLYIIIHSDENYNLNVVIRPDKERFRHIYYGYGLPISFWAGAFNEGPENSPEFTLRFEVIKIFPNKSYIYNETNDFPSMLVGPTETHLFTWYTLIGFHFGIYEVRATIDVDDNYLEDNMEDYSIIILH